MGASKRCDEVFDQVEIGRRPPFTPHPDVPNILIDIMKLAWKHDPNARPDFSEIFNTLKRWMGKQERQKEEEAGGIRKEEIEKKRVGR